MFGNEYHRERYNRLKGVPEEDKKIRIKGWKGLGLIDDYEHVHDIWEKTHECMRCSIPISGKNKHMDHDHITKLYRAFLCNSCNTGNLLDTVPSRNNTLGEKWISPVGKKFLLKRQTKNDEFSIKFDTLAEAIKYRDEYIHGLLNRN